MVLIKKKKKNSLSADIFIKAAGSGCLCREVKKVKNKKNNRRLLCFNHFLFFFSFFFYLLLTLCGFSWCSSWNLLLATTSKAIEWNI